jgi:flagellar basal body-associated protein FliL
MAQEETYSAVTDGPRSVPVRKPKSSVFGFGLIGLLLCIVGLLVWWIVLHMQPPQAAGATRGSVNAVLPLDEFTVNLADPEEGRFLRVTMSLGVDGQLPPAPKSDSTPNDPVSVAGIRDTILSILTQCKSDDLLTADGKAKLKADLLRALDQNVPELRAREIYFTEFLVQR